MKNKIYLERRISKLSILFIIFALLYAITGQGPDSFASMVLPVKAQSASEGWTVPVNLSHSGSTTNPLVVVSTDGQIHVVWEDKFSGYYYSNNSGGKWTNPVQVTLPFSTPVAGAPGSKAANAPTGQDKTGPAPILVADTKGFIHAFWLDIEGNLLYSRVASKDFAIPASWSPALKLAASVLNMNVVADDTGRLHLGYIQYLDAPNLPAGVYSITSVGGKGAWSSPASLYQSPYFRSLTPGSAHVKMSTSGNGDKVYAAWENPARERVFSSRSQDGGKTWDTPIEVDTPVEGTLAGGPNNISINAQDNNVLLIWQTDSSGLSCAQYYQLSVDGGDTWQPRQRMLGDLPGCPSDNQFMAGNDGLIYLLTTINKQVYLLAWNGTQWSQPQLQTTLTSFVDTDTYKSVDFSCRQATMIGGTNLYVVGCDAGNGQDTWITSRQLQDVSAWFSPNPDWSPVFPVTSGQAVVLTPAIATDSEHRIHAFWSQADGAPAGSPGTVIYYSRQEAGQWSSPAAILTSPEGIAEEPAAAVDSQGNLYLVWSGGQSGQIYLSQASAARAVIPSAWSEPKPLPAPKPAGSWPAILIDGKGTIYVTYAIPLNEQRGIYLTWSADAGQTWTQPVVIFDAGAAGWEMVDQPHLSVTSNGQLHIIWTRYSSPSGTGSLGLYYSRSADAGKTWSQPETVVDKPVIWSELVGVGERTIHRFWKELNNGRTTLWHEQSLDGGATWKRIAPVSIFGDTVAQPAVTSDGAGRLHLLQIVNRGTSSNAAQNYSLQHWMYDGEQWQSNQGLDINNALTSGVDYLVAGTSSNGRLAVLFSGLVNDANSGQSQNTLLFTEQQLGVPATAPTPLPPLTPTPALPPTAAPTLAPSPTALLSTTSSVIGSNTGGSIPPSNKLPSAFGQNAWLGSVVGLLVAGLIVVVVFILGTRGAGLRRH